MPEHLLHAAENTPNWDSQALRRHLLHLEPHRHNFSPEQAVRFARLVGRFRRRVAERMGLTAAPVLVEEQLTRETGGESVF